MDYNKLSDHEINKRICDTFWPDMEKSDTCLNKKFPQKTSVVYMHNGYGGFQRDFCNSWDDAGPIIEREFIAINPVMKGWCASSDDDAEVYFPHANPLRAAMIVFLMMKEKSNEGG